MRIIQSRSRLKKNVVGQNNASCMFSYFQVLLNRERSHCRHKIGPSHLAACHCKLDDFSSFPPAPQTPVKSLNGHRWHTNYMSHISHYNVGKPSWRVVCVYIAVIYLQQKWGTVLPREAHVCITSGLRPWFPLNLLISYQICIEQEGSGKPPVRGIKLSSLILFCL